MEKYNALSIADHTDMVAETEDDSVQNDLIKSEMDSTYSDYSSARIHEAARTGNDHVLRFLIEYGMNINLQDREGKTPLMLAASKQYNQLENVRLLLENNADLYIVDNEGRSVFDFDSPEAEKIIEAHIEANFQAYINMKLTGQQASAGHDD